MAQLPPAAGEHGAKNQAYMKVAPLLLAILLLIAISQILVAQRSPLYGDSFGSYLTVLSLVEDGDFDLTNQLENRALPKEAYFSLGKGGQFYSVHEKLLAVLGVPFYLSLGIQGLLVLNIMLGLVFFVAAFCIAQKVTNLPLALLGTTIAALCGRVFYGFSNDLLGATFLIVSTASLMYHRPVLAGMLLGLLPLARLPLVPVAIVVGIYGLFALTRREAVSFLFALLPGLFIFFLTNWMMFGDPLSVSYHRWVEATGQEGPLVRSLANARADGAIIDNLTQVIFAPIDGIFDRNPLWPIVLFLGIPLLVRKDRIFAVFLMVATTVNLLWFAQYQQIEFALHRYFYLLDGFAAILIAAALSRVQRDLRADEVSQKGVSGS